MKTHIIKRCKKQFSAILAAALLLNTCAPAFAQYINQPDKLRVDRTQYDILAAQINKQLEATKKKQEAASRQNVSKKEISDKLKVEYQYEEYDKTGYLKQGQWKGKRKDGSARNTGFFGEIVLQGGAHSGKVITEGLVIIKKNGKEYQVPLLNPNVAGFKADIEELRSGFLTLKIIQNAEIWLDYCLRQNRSVFAEGEEIIPQEKWLYRGFGNIPTVSLTELQKKTERTRRVEKLVKEGLPNLFVPGTEDYKEYERQVEVIEEKKAKAKEAEEDKKAKDEFAKGFLAENPQLNKEDSDKYYSLYKENGNNKGVQREARSLVDKEIRIAQWRDGLKNGAMYVQKSPEELVKSEFSLLKPGKYTKSMSPEEAMSAGLITSADVAKIEQGVIQKHVGKEFTEYLKESDHNIRNLPFFQRVGTDVKYLFTYMENNSITGKLALGTYAGIKGLLTWQNPGDVYREQYQSNQNYLDYYNMGTEFNGLQQIGLMAGSLGVDAGVFKAIGLVSGFAVEGIATLSQTAANVLGPSVSTGIVLGTYNGLNTIGDQLGMGYTDWGEVAQNTGGGAFTGVIVGPFARAMTGPNAAAPWLLKPVVSPAKMINNAVTNVVTGMSEGTVFTLSDAAYDYSVGGNRNAFADITPQSILEDALKFYLAVKLPGNLQHDNTPKRIRNIQKTVVTPVKDPQEKPQNPANDAKQTADAVSNSPKQSLLNKLDEILKQPGLTPEQMHNFKADRSLLENLPESTADGDAKLLDIKNHIMYPAATDNMYAVGGADLGFIEAQFGPGYRTTHISDGSGAWDSPAKGVSLKQINEAIDAAAGTANLSKDFRMDYMAHGRYALNPATGKWGWFSAVGGDYRYTGDGQWTKARQPSAPPAEGEIISAGDIVNIAAKRQAMTGGEGHIVLGQCNAGTGCQADIIDAYKGLPKGEGKLFVYTQSANNNPHTANWSFMSVEKTAGQSVGDNTYASFVEAIRPDYEIGSQITILDRATGNITRIYPLETALSKASGQMKTDLQRVYNLMEADPRDTEGVNAALKEIGRIEGAYVPQEVLSGKIPAKSFNITSSYGDAQEAADLFMENFNTPLSKDGMVSIYIPDQLFNHVADVAEEMNAVGNKKN